MKYSEVKEIIRWYPSDVKNLEGGEIWTKEKMDMYVHIPFCKSKCSFCPFNSKPINKENVDTFFNFLKKELYFYAQENYFKDRIINSLWIGGGTPSAVPIEEIRKLLKDIFRFFDKTEDCEITIETNLADITEEFLSKVAQMGINRISIGVQSFNDKYLKMMGRAYRLKQIEEVLDFLRKYNIIANIDLMYRYPGQTVEELAQELDIAAKYDSVNHISMFPLILFPKLNIYKRIKNGQLPKLPSFETYQHMYDVLIEKLDNNKPFHQYTTYHFAKDGKECKYNVDRWGMPQRECLALGPGPFSQIKDFVYCNEHNVEKYYDKLRNNEKPVQMGKKMTLQDRISRLLVLGTKALSINLKAFKEITGFSIYDLYKEKLDWLINEELVVIDENKMTLTSKGRALIIDVNRAFFTEENIDKTQPQYGILDLFEGQTFEAVKEAIEDAG